MLSARAKGALFACVSAVSYGANPIFAKYLYQDHYSAGSVLFYRFLFGSVLLGLFMLLQRHRFGITRRESVVLLALGAIFAASSLTYFLSFHYMTAGVAATLVFVYPVFVALIMALCFRERLKWPSLLAIAMTGGGIALLYKGDGGQPIAAAGILFIMVSALAYALYIIVLNRSGIVMSGIKISFYAMLFCLMFLTLYVLYEPGGHGITPLHTPWQWFNAVMLGLIPTVISLVAMAVAVRYIGSTPTAIMGALEPVTSTLLGCLLFHEILTARIVSGIGLILFSVALIILDARLRRLLGHNTIVRHGRLLLKRIRWR